MNISLIFTFFHLKKGPEGDPGEKGTAGDVAPKVSHLKTHSFLSIILHSLEERGQNEYII